MVLNIYFMSTICHEEFSAPSRTQRSRRDSEPPSPPAVPKVIKQQDEHLRSKQASSEVVTTAPQSPPSQRAASLSSGTPTYYSSAAAKYRSQLLPTFTVRYLSEANSAPSHMIPLESMAGNYGLGATLRRNSRVMLQCTSAH